MKPTIESISYYSGYPLQTKRAIALVKLIPLWYNFRNTIPLGLIVRTINP